MDVANRRFAEKAQRCAAMAVASLALQPTASLAQSASASGDTRETTPFVVSYRCDRVAVRGVRYRDAATQPIRLAWQGRHYLMQPARSGSGARYLARNGRLEWWSRGIGGFLAVPGVADKVLDNCEAF